MENNDRLRRMDDDLRSLANRVAANERLLAAMPFIREDVKEIKDDCATTRNWVEQRMKDQARAETRRETLTTQQKVAIIGAIAVVCASLIGAVASLASAGAFG